MQRRFSITTAILVVAIATTACFATVLFVQAVIFGTDLARDAARAEFEEIADKTNERMVRFDRGPRDLLAILERLDEVRQPPLPGNGHPALPLFTGMLAGNPALYGIYAGHPNGDFYMVLNVDHWRGFSAMDGVPDETAFAVMVVDGEGANRQRRYAFIDAAQRVVGSRTEATDYDPRARPWYRSAISDGGTVKTAPYVYASFPAPGVTFAKRVAGSGLVLGIDVTLTTLSEFLADQRAGEGSFALMFNEEGNMTALADTTRLVRGGTDGGRLTLSRLEELYPELGPQLLADLPRKPELRTFNGAAEEFVGLIAPIPGSAPLMEYFALMAPSAEIVSPYRQKGAIALYSALATVLLLSPLVWLISRRMSVPIRRLAGEADKLRNLDLERVGGIPTRITELGDLSEAIRHSADAIGDYRANLMTSEVRLKRLIDFGIALSAEKDEDRLMEMILLGAKELSGADGGTLYIRKDDELHFEIMRTTSLDIALGGTTGKEIDLPPVLLRDPDTGSPNHSNVASHAVNERRTVNIPDAYESESFDFSGTRRFDEMNGYRSVSFLTVPLMPRSGEPLGALQLLNAIDPETGEPVPFSPEIEGFIEALAGQSAVALDNRSLVEAQKALLDSFIELIAGAIDAKSPYTGGHCARVPEIAVMLAREAHQDEDHFPSFRLESDDEWREFRIAAWLHDCGKVTTPEYVVDKATKLETLYNRIHEVRTRFEVLRRDAEIRRLRAELDGQGDPAELQKRYEDEIARLDEDFAFVAECNLGGEFMAEDRVARLRQIGAKTWMRHFDDRLGISQAEQERFGDSPAVPLPATERLLDDKPEHIMDWPGSVAPVQDPDKGFAVDVPEHAFNFGEIYNLSIARGTLTPEERYKINEHIIQTILMLENLPLPPHLARVPEYAGAHHETMVGTGYPRRLHRDQMSVPARIMAIADVFEALTAYDRPYKKPKTLSEALRIMSFMVKDEHIDSELFRLFLETGVWRQYAEAHLRPDQIDEVDIEALVA